jgi:hypothetical protein
MKRIFSWKLLRLITILLLSILFVFSRFDLGNAQSQIELSETELVFRGLVGETLQRTVTLTISGEPVQGLQYVISDLVEVESKNVILSEQVSVSPPDLFELSGTQVLTLTISGTQRFGIYEGSIKFFYPGQTAEEDLVLNLLVDVRAVPTVDADVNSKNLTLFVEPSLFDMPFGRAEVNNKSPKLGEMVLSLVQSGDSPAVVSNAKVLAMQSSQGRTLPENAVQVESGFPINLSAKDAATLRVLAKGRNLPSGEYSGTLLVNVENQPGPIQIPLRVQVKDGPFVAFLLLAAGPLVGVLFFYWNKDGKNLVEVQQKIKSVQTILKSGRLLAIQDQQQAKLKLDRVMDAILAQGDLSEVTTQLADIDAFIKGQQAIGEQLLISVQNLKLRLESLTLGTTLRDQLSASLQRIYEEIEAGNCSSWENTQTRIDSYQTQIGEMEIVIQEFNALEANRKTVLQPRLDQARNLDEFKNVVAEGRSIIPKQVKELLVSDEAGTRPDWQKFSLVLQWRKLAVAAVVYFFTLFVGWITLYASAPTFGANREDYITLFLWGVASNVVGGQAIDLKSILSRSSEGASEPGV